MSHPRPTYRWNVEEVDGGVRLCRGDHDRADDCNWEYYTQRPDAGEADRLREARKAARYLAGEVGLPPRFREQPESHTAEEIAQSCTEAQFHAWQVLAALAALAAVPRSTPDDVAARLREALEQWQLATAAWVLTAHERGYGIAKDMVRWAECLLDGQKLLANERLRSLLLAAVLRSHGEPTTANETTTTEGSMEATDKRAAGLYEKFRVERTDGKSAPGEKHHGCQYFVLDLDHDEHAIPALAAYADSCERDYPNLARDLRRIVKMDRAGNALLNQDRHENR